MSSVDAMSVAGALTEKWFSRFLEHRSGDAQPAVPRPTATFTSPYAPLARDPPMTPPSAMAQGGSGPELERPGSGAGAPNLEEGAAELSPLVSGTHSRTTPAPAASELGDAAPYGDGGYEQLDFESHSDDDSPEAWPVASTTPPLGADTTRWAGAHNADAVSSVDNGDPSRATQCGAGEPGVRDDDGSQNPMLAAAGDAAPPAEDGDSGNDGEDFGLSPAASSAQRVLRAGGPWRHRMQERLRNSTSPTWDPPVDRNDSHVLDSRVWWENLRQAGGYYFKVDRERLQSQWRRFAMAVMDARPEVARADMPPLDETSLSLQKCLKHAPRGAITPVAWDHIRASCTESEALRLSANRAYRLGHVHWGYGLIVVPRIAVSPFDGSPRLIANMYTVPQPTERHSWCADNVDNFGLRNILLRWVVGAATSLSRASHDGMDVFHYVNKVWRGMSVDWTGSPLPPRMDAEARRLWKLNSTFGTVLDGACALAGLRRRCSLTFGVTDDDTKPLDPQLFLSLLRGMPSAPVLADIREACVGRLLATATKKLPPDADISAQFVRQLCRSTRGLTAEWQRVRLFEVLAVEGYRCAVRVFENPHPIPFDYRQFMLYDPGQNGPDSRGALPSDAVLLRRALDVLKMHEAVNTDYHGARKCLLEFRDTSASTLEAYMPSHVYSSANTSLWYDSDGGLIFTHSG